MMSLAIRLRNPATGALLTSISPYVGSCCVESLSSSVSPLSRSHPEASASSSSASGCTTRTFSTDPASSSTAAAATPGPSASPRVKDLADQIVGLTVLECSQLTELVRSKLGMQKPTFSSAPMMAAAAPSPSAPAAATAAAAAPAAKVEKTEFDVKLDSFSAEGKIKVIKEVRTLTALGLKEAKELVEKAPVVVKSSMTKAEAENVKKQLEAAGAKVSLV